MHPEAEALLNAIYDHPDDDTPRLVYADWLQEHGQDDYAHFLRLSIRAANPATPVVERNHVASQRKQFWKRMVAVRHDAMRSRIQRHDFRRGMCDVVSTSADSFLRTAESWWPALAPRELVLHNARGIQVQLVREVALRLPWLRTLALHSGPTRYASELSSLGYAPLSGSLFAEFAAPGAFPRLVVLTVSVAKVDHDALAALAASPLAERLRSLRLLFQLPRPPGVLHVERHGREGDVREELNRLLEQLG